MAHISIDSEWVLKTTVVEIVRKSIIEEWNYNTLDKWLKIKQVQYLGEISDILSNIKETMGNDTC